MLLFFFVVLLTKFYLGASSTTELRDSFYTNVEKTSTEFKAVTGAVLYQSDLKLWSTFGKSDSTFLIDAPVFSKFMAVSHSPVTVVTILLPELVQTGRGGVDNGTRTRLKDFRDDLVAASSSIQVFVDTDQEAAAESILNSVSAFVDKVLDSSSGVDMAEVRRFASDLEGSMRRAASLAVGNYFMRLVQLTTRLSIAFNWSVVVSAKEFAYNGSFLHQFFERVFFSILYGRSDSFAQKRVTLKPGGFPSNSSNSTCTFMSDLSTQLAHAASDQIYRNQLNAVFKYGPSVHSILSDAADEVICSGMLHQSLQKCPANVKFFGFETIWERAYVILLVTFFSVALFLLVIVLSIFSEDRMIKAKKSYNKNITTESNGNSYGPNLLEPIGDAKCNSTYVEYRDVQRKHSAGFKASDSTFSVEGNGNSPVRNSVSRRSHHRYSQFSNHVSDEDETGAREEERPQRVSRTEVKLEELAEF